MKKLYFIGFGLALTVLINCSRLLAADTVSPGENIISNDYDYVSCFEYGYASVKKAHRWGLINRSGELIIPIVYNAIIVMRSSDIALVAKNTGMGAYNLKNKELFIPPVYKNIYFALKRDVFIVKTSDDKTGYIDLSGKIIFPIVKLKWARRFSDGLAEIEDDQGVFFIDETGQKVLGPLAWPQVFDFHEGLAAVSTEAGPCKGMPSMGDAPICQAGKLGFINKQGKLVIPTQFDRIGGPVNGVIKFAIKKDQSYEWGLADKNGKIIVEPSFFDIEIQKDNTAIVQVKKYSRFLRGKIDLTNGQVLIEPK